MNCPCCSGTLLRHINRTGLYWYCSKCHLRLSNIVYQRSLNYQKVNKPRLT